MTDELLTDGRLIFYMLGAFINCWLFMDGISIAHECRNYWLFYKENRLTADRQTHSNFINMDKIRIYKYLVFILVGSIIGRFDNLITVSD